jgi:2-phosphoglycerate kinase
MMTKEPAKLNCTALVHDFLPGNIQHVLWLGGSPCSGKSSITDFLSKQYAIQVYHVDDAFLQHSPNFTLELYPVNYKWTHTPWQELWMQSQQELFEQAIEAYTEHLRFVFADLRNIEEPVIAEGTSLLPDCIKPLITDVSQALWVVPTEAFQRKTYPQRGVFVAYILQHCDDPEIALQNWMDRDVAFARWVEERTRHLKLPCIRIDGRHSIEENAAFVASHFQLV